MATAASPPGSGSVEAPHPATIRNLQLLRAVAAFLVVAHHYFEYPRRYIEGWPETVAGAAGVDIFFVLSGIVMAITTTGRRVDPLDFLARRAWRIVPLYWLVTSVVFALLLIGLHPLGLHDWTGADVLASYLFQPSEHGPILVVGWTLDFEMLFYLAVALSLTIRPTGVRAALLLGVLSLCAVAGAALGIEQDGSAQSYGELFLNTLLLEFVAGYALGLAYRHGTAQPVSRPALLRTAGWTAVVLAIAGLAAAELMLDGMPQRSRVLLFGLPAVAACAGLLLLERGGLATRQPLALFLGDASFALYLIHPLIGQAFEKLSVRLLPQSASVVAVTLALSVVATTVLAAIVHLRIERPLQRLGRAYFETARRPGRSPRAEPATAAPAIAPTHV